MDYLVKLAKFGVVGLIGMCVDFFTTWLLKEKLQLNKYVANSIGFTCAVVLNFFLNLHWTFQASAQNAHVYKVWNRTQHTAIFGGFKTKSRSKP